MYDAFLPSALAYKYTRVYKLKGLSEGIGSFCPWSADVPGRAGRDALSRVHLIRIVNACHGLPAPDPSSCGSHQRSICVPCGDLEVSLVSVSPNPALAPTDTMLCSAVRSPLLLCRHRPIVVWPGQSHWLSTVTLRSAYTSSTITLLETVDCFHCLLVRGIGMPQ